MLSTSTPPTCAIASTCSTPGITGAPGKCPTKNGSFMVTFFIPITSVSVRCRILSTSRNGGLCGSSFWMPTISNTGGAFRSTWGGLGALASCFTCRRSSLASSVLALWPGCLATICPLMRCPTSARSPSTSSSLWRAGSFSKSSGRLLSIPCAERATVGLPKSTASRSISSCCTSIGVITRALARSPPFIRFSSRSFSSSCRKTKVRHGAISSA